MVSKARLNAYIPTAAAPYWGELTLQESPAPGATVFKAAIDTADFYYLHSGEEETDYNGTSIFVQGQRVKIKTMAYYSGPSAGVYVVTLTVGYNNIVWPASGGKIQFTPYEYPLTHLISRFSADGVFYKDLWTVYPGHAAATPPVLIAGGPYVVRLSNPDDTASFTVDLRNSYSPSPDVTIGAYSCTARANNYTGLTITGIAETESGLYAVTVSNSGAYPAPAYTEVDAAWLIVSCTDSNGITTTGQRLIVASKNYKRPYLAVELATITGNIDRGGYSASLTLSSNRGTPASVMDGSPVVIWDEAIDPPQLVFFGYATGGRVTVDEGAVKLQLTAESVSMHLSRIGMFAVSLSAVISPADWYEYASWLTTGRAVCHLWQWHSNLMAIADVYGLNNTWGRKYCDMPQGNLWQMAMSMAKSQQAKLCTSRNGAIYWRDDPLLLSDTDRAAVSVVKDLDETDILGDITLTRQPLSAANVSVSGLVYSGVSIADSEAIELPEIEGGIVLVGGGSGTATADNVTAVIAKAPGYMINPAASFLDYPNQVLLSDTQALTLAERLLALHNAVYPEAEFELPWDYLQYLEPEKAQFLTLTIPNFAEFDERRIAVTGLRLNYNPLTGAASIGCECQIDPDTGAAAALVTYPKCLKEETIEREPPTWEVTNVDTLLLFAFTEAAAWKAWQPATGDWSALASAGTGTSPAAVLDPLWFERASSATDSPLGYNPTLTGLIKLIANRVMYSNTAGGSWRDISPNWNRVGLNNIAYVDAAVGEDTFYVIANNTTWGHLAVTTANNALVAGNRWWDWQLLLEQGTYHQALAIAPAADGCVVLLFKYDNLLLQHWTITPSYTTGAAGCPEYHEVSFVLTTEIDLGDCTEAQLESGERAANIFEDNGSYIIYGRLNDPDGISGAAHVVRWTIGDDEVVAIEDGWGDERCAALTVANGEIYAVKSGDYQSELITEKQEETAERITGTIATVSRVKAIQLRGGATAASYKINELTLPELNLTGSDTDITLTAGSQRWGVPYAERLSDTQALICYGEATSGGVYKLWAAVVTISDTDPALGTAVEVFSSSTLIPQQFAACLLTNDGALVAVSCGDSSILGCALATIEISGSALTVHAVTGGDDIDAWGENLALVRMTDTAAVIGYESATFILNTRYLHTVSVSSGTLTIGAAADTSGTANTAIRGNAFQSGYLMRSTGFIRRLSDTDFMLFYFSYVSYVGSVYTTKSRCSIGTVSGNIISIAAPVDVFGSDGRYNNLCLIDGGVFYAEGSGSVTTDVNFYYRDITITDGAPSVGSADAVQYVGTGSTPPSAPSLSGSGHYRKYPMNPQGYSGSYGWRLLKQFPAAGVELHTGPADGPLELLSITPLGEVTPRGLMVLPDTDGTVYLANGDDTDPDPVLIKASNAAGDNWQTWTDASANLSGPVHTLFYSGGNA